MKKTVAAKSTNYACKQVDARQRHINCRGFNLFDHKINIYTTRIYTSYNIYVDSTHLNCN